MDFEAHISGEWDDVPRTSHLTFSDDHQLSTNLSWDDIDEIDEPMMSSPWDRHSDSSSGDIDDANSPLRADAVFRSITPPPPPPQEETMWPADADLPLAVATQPLEPEHEVEEPRSPVVDPTGAEPDGDLSCPEVIAAYWHIYESSRPIVPLPPPSETPETRPLYSLVRDARTLGQRWHPKFNSFPLELVPTKLSVARCTDAGRPLVSAILTGNDFSCHMAHAREARTTESANWLAERVTEASWSTRKVPNWMIFVYKVLEHPHLDALELRKEHCKYKPSFHGQWIKDDCPPNLDQRLRKSTLSPSSSTLLPGSSGLGSQIKDGMDSLVTSWIAFYDALEQVATKEPLSDLYDIAQSWPQENRLQYITLLGVAAVLFGEPKSLIQPIEIFLWVLACTVPVFTHAPTSASSPPANVNHDFHSSRHHDFQPLYASSSQYSVIEHPEYYLPPYPVVTPRQCMFLLSVLDKVYTTEATSPMLHSRAFKGCSISSNCRGRYMNRPRLRFNVATLRHRFTFAPRHKEISGEHYLHKTDSCLCRVCVANKGATMALQSTIYWPHPTDLCATTAFVSLLQCALYRYGGDISLCTRPVIRGIVFRANQENNIIGNLCRKGSASRGSHKHPVCCFSRDHIGEASVWLNLIASYSNNKFGFCLPVV